MIRYFIDSEFNEDGKSIDLISLALVAEDGRQYYAIRQEFDVKKAEVNEWVKKNVLAHLPLRVNPAEALLSDIEAAKPWRRTLEIIRDLVAFCDPEKYGKPEFWGYYSSYDHVVLCQLFGAMVNLPKGWPMLTYDLRQALDERGFGYITQPDDAPHHALTDAQWIADTFKVYVAPMALKAKSL